LSAAALSNAACESLKRHLSYWIRYCVGEDRHSWKCFLRVAKREIRNHKLPWSSVELQGQAIDVCVRNLKETSGHLKKITSPAFKNVKF
jgi:hypothetical protein